MGGRARDDTEAKKRPRTKERRAARRCADPPLTEDELAQKFYAFARWIFDTYKGQLALGDVPGGRRYRKFISGMDFSTCPVSGLGRIQKFQIVKFEYPLAHAGYSVGVFSFDLKGDTPRSNYAYAYWRGAGGDPEYICLSPTFESRDGEYRERFIWYPNFDKAYADLTTRLSALERVLLRLAEDGRLELGVDIYPEAAAADLVAAADERRLAIRALAGTLLPDVESKNMSGERIYQTHTSSAYTRLIETVAAAYKKAATPPPPTLSETFRIVALVTGRVGHPSLTECGQKLVPLSVRQASQVGDVSFAPWREVWTSRKATDLVINGVAPNFPIFDNWTYLNGVHRHLFENPSMMYQYTRSDRSRVVASDIRAARGRLPDVETDYHMGQFDTRIYDSLVYAQDYLILTDLALCMVSEFVGPTWRSRADVLIGSSDREGATSQRLITGLLREPARGARYLFDLCYGAHALHTRTGCVHTDLHLNNMTLFSVGTRLVQSETPEGRIVEEEILPDTSSIVYIAGPRGAVDTYVFPHDGWYSFIIDFSRVILGPGAAADLTAEHGAAYTETFYRRQANRVLRTLHRYAPTFVEKNQEKIKGAILANFDQVFEALTAVDFLAIGHNMGLLWEELSRVEGLEVAPENLELPRRLERVARRHLVERLAAIVGEGDGAPGAPGAPGPTALSGPPGPAILSEVFGDYSYPVLAQAPGNPLQETMVTDVYNVTAPMPYSGSDYSRYPPWARFDMLKKQLKGIPVEELTAGRTPREFFAALRSSGLFDALVEEAAAEASLDSPGAATSSWIAE